MPQTRASCWVRPACRDRGRCRGLTLVELLLVAVLLGFGAAVLAGSTGAASERAAFRVLLHDIEALDARARAHARAGTPVLLATDPDRSRLVAHVRHGGELVSELLLPEDTTVVLVRDGATRARSITFHPSGTSPDYAIEASYRGESARIEVAGLTGWVTRWEKPR